MVEGVEQALDGDEGGGGEGGSVPVDERRGDGLVLRGVLGAVLVAGEVAATVMEEALADLVDREIFGDELDELATPVEEGAWVLAAQPESEVGGVDGIVTELGRAEADD